MGEPSSWDEILDELRWKPDQVVVSPTNGEFMYLKTLFDSNGKLLGLTDCCFYDDPCAKHKALSQVKPRASE